MTPAEARPVQAGRRHHRLLPYLVGGVYVLFALATLSRQYTFDAISYLGDVERTRLGWPIEPGSITYNFFHSQHLLFSPVVYLWYHLCASFGYAGSALAPAQFLNILEGSVTLVLLCRLLIELTGDGTLAALVTSILGISYAFWDNTAMVSDHMASCLMAVVFFGILLRTTVAEATARRLLLLGFLNGLAMLMHQVNGLLGAVFLAALAFERMPARARLRAFLVYTAAATLTVAVPYLIVGVFILGNATPYDFVFWSFYYAMPGVINVAGHYGTVSIAKLAELLAGFRGAAVGGFYWMNRIFEERTLELVAVPAFGAIAALALAATGLLARFRAERADAPAPVGRAIRLAAVWFFVYALLLFWWWPSYYQLWAVPFVGGAIWLAAWLHRALLGAAPARHARVMWGLGIVAGALFVANLIGAYLPMRDIENNDYYTVTSALGPYTAPGDLVVIPGNDEYETYIPYFIKRDIVSLHAVLIEHENDIDSSLAEIGSRMAAAQAAGGRVFIVAELRDSVEAYADVYDLHGITNDDVAPFFRRFALEEAIHAGSMRFYRLGRELPSAASQEHP